MAAFEVLAEPPESPFFRKEDDFPWEYFFDILDKNGGSQTGDKTEGRYPLAKYYNPEGHGYCPALKPDKGVCQPGCARPDPVKELIALAKPTRLMVHPMMGQCPLKPLTPVDFDDIVRTFYSSEKRQEGVSDKKLPDTAGCPKGPDTPLGTDNSPKPEPTFDPRRKSDEPVCLLEEKPEPWTGGGTQSEKKSFPGSIPTELFHYAPTPDVSIGERQSLPPSPPVHTEGIIPPQSTEQNIPVAGAPRSPVPPIVQSPQAGPDYPDVLPVTPDSVVPASLFSPAPETSPVSGAGGEPVLQITYEPDVGEGPAEPYTPSVEEMIDIINRERKTPATEPELPVQNTALAIRFDEDRLGPQSCDIREAPQTCPVSDIPVAEETDEIEPEVDQSAEKSEPRIKPEPDSKPDEDIQPERKTRPEKEKASRPEVETVPELQPSSDTESVKEKVTDEVVKEDVFDSEATSMKYPTLSELAGNLELIPEFESLSNMSSLFGVMQIHTLSALNMMSNRIWQNYGRQRGNPEFFPEVLSFAHGNSQFARHEFSVPVYTFIHGSQQSGDYQGGTVGRLRFFMGGYRFCPGAGDVRAYVVEAKTEPVYV